MSVVLDTHVWIWWLASASRLAPRERRALDAAASRGPLALSAISLWEAQMLSAKGRFLPEGGFEAWLRLAASAEAVTVLPLDVDVVAEVDRLPTDLDGDPADRVIVATARVHGLPLATYDRRIRRSRAVKLWRL